jgi:glycerol-3-phosphate dehydrogenase
MLSDSERVKAVAQLKDNTFDLLVVGGGIVGSGVARDAAMRGLKVALIEQHDFAFGTSSRSSRLLHGGLRYLAQGRVGLVREASVEKKILHQIAPHLAAPLPFVFPTYRGNKNWVLWQLKIGVKIYDLLCGGRNLGQSTWLSRSDVASKVPALSTKNLNGAVRYFDGFTNDARLVLDTLRSAGRAGAALLNYAKFQDAKRGDTGLWECQARDVSDDQRFTIRARQVVNATGPWADRVPHSRIQLRATKGVHIVVQNERVPVRETVVMTEGKRILFAIPWGSRTILGTTDTDYTGSAEEVRTEAEDVAYLLKITNDFFPAARLKPGDVISAWAGLRPLIADPDGKPSDISRSHEITNSEPGWWDIAGGKLTTYRLMAEQTVDRVIMALKKDRALTNDPKACTTAREPLLPESETAGLSGILPPEVNRRTVEHFCMNEWARHLDDVMVRRTGWHYYLTDAAAVAEKVADWMGELLGWSDSIRNAELQRYFKATGVQRAPGPAKENLQTIASR